MVRVVCVGSVTKDIFLPTSEGVLLDTPEDLISQKKVAFELGGKFRAKVRYEATGGVPGNLSVGLSRLGVTAYCYAKVGHDDIGRWIKQELESHAVETETLFIDPQAKSDLSAIIVIEQSGDRLIFHHRDASEKLEILPDRFPESDWLYITALNGRWQKNLKLLLEIKQERGLKLALNPGQHNLKEDPRLLLETLHETDVLVLNKDEAIEMLLKGGVEDDPKKLNDESFLVEELHARGAALVALTDGKRGAWAFDGKTCLHADIYEAHGVVDTTGAGDAFGSGFLSAHVHHLPLETCLAYGIANGGSVAGFYGAIEGLLDQEQMTQALSHIHVAPFLKRHIPIRSL